MLADTVSFLTKHEINNLVYPLCAVNLETMLLLRNIRAQQIAHRMQTVQSSGTVRN